jgi:hypothetical protein
MESRAFFASTTFPFWRSHLGLSGRNLFEVDNTKTLEAELAQQLKI